jgi:hypothetical protein
VSLEEIEHLARNHGFAVEKVQHAADQQGRVDVSWTNVAVRLPDDGTGALPLLRHVILNDQKSATYKLGLFRALCRAADGSAGMVQDAGDEFVRVPLGLVALNWLRLYLPLIRESLPQTPTNVDAQGLRFAKEGFQALLSGVSASDLRIGARFTLDRAQALHAALRDAAQTIDRMPSTFMTYPMGGRILPVERGRLKGPPSIVELDTDYLTAFGWMRVPGHLWRSMRRNAAWIEPTLIAEWMRLMREYARGQNRPLADTKMFAAMRWSDPARDVSRARQVALSVVEAGNLHCAWTDRPLSRNTLDIDLCSLGRHGRAAISGTCCLPIVRLTSGSSATDCHPRPGCSVRRAGSSAGGSRHTSAEPRTIYPSSFCRKPAPAFLRSRPTLQATSSRRFACSASGCGMTNRCRNGRADYKMGHIGVG